MRAGRSGPRGPRTPPRIAPTRGRDDRDLGDPRVPLKDGFHLRRPDLLPARVDEVVEAAGHPNPATAVDPSRVSRQEPPPVGERPRGCLRVVDVATHHRRAAELDPSVVVDPNLGPGEGAAVVHDPATALGQAVGLDHVRPLGPGLIGQPRRDGRPPDQDRPEMRQVGVGVEKADQHRGDERHEGRVRLGGDGPRVEPGMDGDRCAEQDRPEQHEEPSDVGQGKTAQPPVVGRGVQGQGRGGHGGVDGRTVELDELGDAPRAGGVDHQSHVVSHRSARASPVPPIGIDDDRGDRPVHHVSSLGCWESVVHREQGRAGIPNFPQDALPVRTRGESDRHQVVCSKVRGRGARHLR